jgi:phenylpropionate dioxygenase-like ring-hydroxylating dioxygenase large terminal subunit
LRKKQVQSWVERVEKERARSAPPGDFPTLPELPSGRYVDPGFFDAEKELMWRRCWLYAAHEDQLSDPGDCVLWNYGSSPIVLICGDDGEVRAFYNTCRHRGAPVVQDGSSRVNRQMICGYHGWSYDREGRLVSASEPRDWDKESIRCRNLIPVRCEKFACWYFVNEDSSSESLEEFLRPVTKHLAHLSLKDLKLVHRSVCTVPANIKIVIENFLESYHFNFLHKNTTHRFLDNRGTSVHLWKNGHSLMLSPNRRRNWQDPGTVGLPEMQGCTEIEKEHNPSYCVFPNLILPIAPTGIPGVAMWPIDLDSSVLEVLWFSPEHAGDSNDPIWEFRIKNFARIIQEDVQFAGPIQKSVKSPGFTGVALSYQERRIYHWHETLDDYLEGQKVGKDLRVPRLLEDWIE